MGVRTRVVLYAPNAAAAEEGAAAAFDEIGRLEQIMSDYRWDSELSAVCVAAGDAAVVVSEDLFAVLSAAQRMASETDGAFDVTAGPVVRLWREARRVGALPAPEDLDRARRLVGFDKLMLGSRFRTVALAVRGMQIDLGGIGKGYAAQAAVGVLRRRGLPRCLVALAGDVVVGDAPPGEPGWTIDTPLLARGRLVLTNKAVSTSGDTEQFVEIGGVRYSHIVDPRTGLGMTTRAAVTVIAPDGATADALATAICVAGAQPGFDLVRARPNVAMVFAHRGPGGRVVIVDPGGLIRPGG